MNTPNFGSDEQRLAGLFQAYREACTAPDPSANFMPELWRKIEARQNGSFVLGRLASGFVTAAVALTLAMAVYLYFPRSTNAFYSETYVEALASHSTDTAGVEPVQLDLAAATGEL
jgi:hypothetical protein